MKAKRWAPPYCDLCDYKTVGYLGVATARVVINKKKGFTRDIFDVCAQHAAALKKKYADYDVGVGFDFWDEVRKRLEINGGDR